MASTSIGRILKRFAGLPLNILSSSVVLPTLSKFNMSTVPEPSRSVSALKETTDVTPEVSASATIPEALRLRETKDVSVSDAPLTKKPDFVRIKKRKVVLMLSYCGQGYFGMQKNPEMRTIEADLFGALLKNNYIDDESYNRPQILQFQRAARTDKNVSAARQIVSLKAPENLEISKLNESLPKCIRVMGMKRVTQGFDSKNNCDARTYSYMLPTFAFAPIEETVTETYRISPEVLEEVRKTLALYVGSKNFHNFTSKKRFGDPSSIRVIMSFTCSDPFERDGLEYVILRVKGQSFMLHQIRKMIGLATAILRGFASLENLKKAWTDNRIDIPRAPGVGLMLEEVHYKRYDDRYGKDGMHETLTWDHVKSEVEQFCEEYIYSVVTKAEREEKSMLHWLSTLAFHSYDVRDREQDEKNGYSSIGKAYAKVAYFSGQKEEEDDEDDGEDDDAEGSSKKRKVDRRESPK